MCIRDRWNGVCMCILYTYICGCTRIFMRVYCEVYTCTRVCLCEFMCLVAYYSVLDSFGDIRTQLQETRTRSRFVLVVDPIQWRFEDRPMGWFIDPYRFLQWRPDGDSVPKSVISCECSFLCIFLFTVVGTHLHVTLIISCDFLLYFTSPITCTTWRDIYDCSL